MCNNIMLSVAINIRMCFVDYHIVSSIIDNWNIVVKASSDEPGKLWMLHRTLIKGQLLGWCRSW